MIEHRRLRIDTRKWAAAKMAPKKYGEKSNADVNVMSLEELVLGSMGRWAPPGRLAGSPANIGKRGIIWNGRSPCSNPAATTNWPFASDTTPASVPWPF